MNIGDQQVISNFISEIFQSVEGMANKKKSIKIDKKENCLIY